MKCGAVSTFVRWFLLEAGILFFASMAVAHGRVAAAWCSGCTMPSCSPTLFSRAP